MSVTELVSQEAVVNPRMFKISYLLILIVFELTSVLPASQRSGSRNVEIGVPTHGKCEPITVQLCRDIQYNETIMPNLFGHNTQEEAGSIAQQYLPLVKVQCNSYFKFFLCSLYFPVCTVLDEALPPCKSLCKQAKEGCEVLMNNFGFEWPEAFECSRFPESDLCVGENRTESQNNNNNRLTPHRGAASLGGKTKRPINRPAPKELTCPGFMKVNVKYDYKLVIGDSPIKHCGMPCTGQGDLFNVPERRELMRLIVCVVACLCLLCSLFTFLTFVVDTQRFRYPERPIVFISACYCVMAIAYIVGFAIGNRASCSEFTEKYLDEDTPFVTTLVTQGTKREGCTVLFVLLYFSGLASSIWWVILTLTFFLSAGLKWGQEAVENRSMYFHLVAWAVPGVMTIVLLALGQVDGDMLTGVCYTGLVNGDMAKAFVISPMITILTIGTVFLLAGFFSLCRVRRAMKHDGSRTDKLEKLMVRIGIFGVFYVVPISIVVGCVFYEMAWHDEWMKGWYHRLCTTLSASRVSQLDEASFGFPGFKDSFQFQNWACGDYLNRFASSAYHRPDITVFGLKHLMTLVVGVACGFWVCSGKTAESWSRFFCRSSYDKKQQQHQLQQKELQPALL